MTRRGPGEGSIYQRSDGRWTAEAHLGYVGGKRRRKQLYGRTRADVASQLRALQASLERGFVPAPERLTVGQFLASWLEQVQPTVRPATYRSYEGVVRIHLVPTLGRTRLTQLGPDEVQRLLNLKAKAGLRPRTVGTIRTVLRTALNKAVRWGYLERNVAALTDPPRTRVHEINVLSPAQARSLLDQVAGSRLEALYAVALAVGLRQGEALGLRWEDVDLDEGSMAIRHALQRQGSGLILVEPKSASSRRMLNLPEVALSALRRHRARQNAERLRAGAAWRDEDFVFATELGRPLDARNVVRHFKAQLKAAALPDMRFHDLRHSCATLLLAQGVPARAVQDLLGHSQISLTLGTYSHVSRELRAEVASSMDRALGTGAAQGR